MANVTVPLALLLGAYVLGMFPTADLVGRRQGVDVTREGSGNPGASNVYRVAGKRAGLVVFLGDLLKGAVAGAAGLATVGAAFGLACGIAAVLGHCFPVLRGFRGGKGVATGGGAVLAVLPLVAVGGMLMWVLVAKITGKASLGSLLLVFYVPVAMFVLGRTAAELAVASALGLLILGRHADNIARLLRGEERSLREQES